jgi:sugar phosphate isomerase/epimerase
MYLSGFADEAGSDIDTQIKAVKTLGWRHIEMRNVGSTNFTLIPDDEFLRVKEKLGLAGITISCFGSGIANWAKKLSDPPESSYDEMRQAIPRMHATGTTFIRIMSFAQATSTPLSDRAAHDEAIKRLKVIVKMAEDGGVVCVHENCTGWAGQSYEHTLRMLEEIPSKSLKLVFDTGNPVGDKDVRGSEPYAYQNAWEFYRQIRDHIVYMHIKDGKIIDGKLNYVFPGEGDGCVRKILADLQARGYDGGISAEPHLAVVAHDASKKPDAQIRFDNYVEFGRRLENILKAIGWKPQP